MFGVLNAILLQIWQHEGMNSLNLRVVLPPLSAMLPSIIFLTVIAKGLPTVVFKAINPCVSPSLTIVMVLLFSPPGPQIL